MMLSTDDDIPLAPDLPLPPRPHLQPEPEENKSTRKVKKDKDESELCFFLV